MRQEGGNMASDDSLGSPFERFFVAALAIATGAALVYLAVQGPLIRGAIVYKTAAVISNQLVGQDAVNLAVLSPILFISGAGLLLSKRWAVSLLLASPLFLMYYALSYSIGWEWSSPVYTGNSQRYAFFFIFILAAALIILLYALAASPKRAESRFKKPSLTIYSVLFSVFLLVFAAMWIKEVQDVIRTGTTRGYDMAPTVFWLVRVFDLGFSVPLGLVSVYLLWARPDTAYPVISLFYGFFFTQIIAVNAMGWVMFLKHDPTFMMRDMVVFSILAVIIFFGFFYVRRNYQLS
jgi:hypothetical protein